MQFKTKRINEEWNAMVGGFFPDLLVPLALYVDVVSRQVADKEAIITGIFRSGDQQAAIIKAVNLQRIAQGKLPWSPSRKSVHQYWRGIDFRSSIYTEEQRVEIIRRINKRFYYSGKYSVLAHHKNGTAGHLHGQVQAGEQWRMK